MSKAAMVSQVSYICMADYCQFQLATDVSSYHGILYVGQYGTKKMTSKYLTERKWTQTILIIKLF